MRSAISELLLLTSHSHTIKSAETMRALPSTLMYINDIVHPKVESGSIAM